MESAKTRTYQAALNSALIGTGLSVALMLPAAAHNRAMAILAGLPVVAIAGYIPALIHQRYGLKGGDYMAIFGEVRELLEPVTEEMGETLVRFIPEQLKSRDRVSDTSWISKSNEQFSLIFAKPKKGKTIVALLKIESLIQSNPNGYHLRVVDFDFGKRGNDWGGLPREIIVRSLMDAEAAVAEFYQELKRRADVCAETPKQREDFQPWFFVIDESASVIPQMSEDTQFNLAELIRRGQGFNISGIIISQSPAVNQCGLPESVKSLIDKICVNPDHSDQLSEILNKSAAQSYVNECLERSRQGLRSAVWHGDEGTQTVAIPDRKDNPPRFKDERQSVQEWLDSLDQGWLTAILTSHDSPTAAFNAVMESWEDIKPEGAKKPKRTGQDPYWNAIKQRYEDLSK